VPLLGPPDIEKLERKRDVDGLVRALAYKKDYGICKAAVIALGRLGDARAVPGLVGVLNDRSLNSTHLEVIGALARIGDPVAVEPLAARIGHDFPPNEDAVVEALGRMGPAAVDPLVGTFEQAWTVKRNLWTTGSSGRPAGFIGNVAEALARIGDRRAIAPLVAALQDYEAAGYINRAPYGADYGPAIAVALAKVADSSLAEPLAAAAQRYWCACPELVEALERLAPSDPRVRAIQSAAARQWESCTQLGTVAVEPLVTFLANGRFYVDKRGWPHHGADRAPGEDEAATNAVLAIGEAAVGPLTRILESRAADEPDPRRTLAAIDLLGRTSDPRAVEPVYAALEGAGVPAVAALVELGDPAVDRLADAMAHSRADVREAAVQGLEKMGTARAIAALRGTLSDPRYAAFDSVRAAGAKALGRTESAPIEVAAQDRDGELAVRCPVCRGSFAVERADLGSEITCPRPSCKTRLRLSAGA
jgi:HEAT repeat protein